MSRHVPSSISSRPWRPWRHVLTALALAACMGACDDAESLDVSSIEACPGAQAPPDGATPCRHDVDCSGVDGFEPFCRPVEEPLRICGAPLCNRSCESDADCSADGSSVCVEFPGSCAGVCGPDTRCEPACTETSCLAGFACAEDGHCRPLPCDDASFACPANLRCVPAASDADEHGCQRLPCDRDDDCDCGACVTGRCWGHLGVCETGDPVP